MENEQTQHDIEYLRRLAESGRSSAPLGGRFLVWWGGLLSCTYTFHYLIVSGTLGLGQANPGWLWIGFAVLGMLGQGWLSWRFPDDKPGAAAVGNRVELVIWNVAATAIFAYFAALVVKSLAQGHLDRGFDSSLPLVFSGYAIALLTTGVIAHSSVLRNAGVIAMLMVVVVTLVTGTAVSWLLAALGMFITAFVPGCLLLRAEPAGVEQ